ncbi:MAG: hypothetical protein NVSMB9_23500 [Isosphaeraceae bacterium]
MDIARWLIPGATLPKSVQSLGGRFAYRDQGETANTQVTQFDFGDTQLIFEVRGLKTNPYHGEMVSNIAHFEGGVVAPSSRNRGLRFFPRGSDPDSKGEPIESSESAGRESEGGHFANFIAAVRSRKVDDLNADILEAHYSSALCHLANISYRLGAPVPFQSHAKPFGTNAEANEALDRMQEHLAHDNGLKLDGQSYRLGRKLTVDAPRESFVGDPEANALLTRSYRKPFAVPETIA